MGRVLQGGYKITKKERGSQNRRVRENQHDVVGQRDSIAKKRSNKKKRQKTPELGVCIEMEKKRVAKNVDRGRRRGSPGSLLEIIAGLT